LGYGRIFETAYQNLTQFFMKQFAVLFLIGLFMGCTQNVPAQTNAVTRTVQATAFTGIRATGKMEVQLTTSATYSVKVMANQALLDELDVEVKGNDLVIKAKRDDWNWDAQAEKITVMVSAPNIERIDLSGDLTFKTQNSVTPTRFELNTSGAVFCSISVVTENAKITTSGQGEVVLRGKAPVLHVNMSGSGFVRAYDLSAIDVKVGTSGTAEVEVSASRTLEVSSSGSSNVHYKGKPKVDIKASGSGKATKTS
jgi:Putative auto-transporter adhesin, head GIN domain